jgi:hypothetical protein
MTHGQIHNMFGPTVWEGDIEEMIETLVRLNDPRQNAGLYKLHVRVRDQDVFLVPLDAVKSYHVA